LGGGGAAQVESRWHAQRKKSMPVPSLHGKDA